jgi:hypothetical protein
VALYRADLDVIVRLRRTLEVYAESDASALDRLEGMTDADLFQLSTPRPDPVTIFETYLLKMEREL